MGPIRRPMQNYSLALVLTLSLSGYLVPASSPKEREVYRGVSSHQASCRTEKETRATFIVSLDSLGQCPLLEEDLDKSKVLHVQLS